MHGESGGLFGVVVVDAHGAVVGIDNGNVIVADLGDMLENQGTYYVVVAVDDRCSRDDVLGLGALDHADADDVPTGSAVVQDAPIGLGNIRLACAEAPDQRVATQ